MQLLRSGNEVNKCFAALAKKHTTLSFATAWASAKIKAFHAMRKLNIVSSVVGTHFFQTDPDFLKAFIDSDSVKCIVSPEGVFHPKVYLFSNEHTRAWDILIGSANFTGGGFGCNDEVMVHLTSKHDEPAMNKSMRAVLKGYWNRARTIDAVFIERYRSSWEAKDALRRRLSEQYADERKKRTSLDTPLMQMSWAEFYREAKKDPHHSPEERLDVIRKIREIFYNCETFSTLREDERRFIGGIANGISDHFGVFGSMTGAGTYKNKIIENDNNISKALDKIPLTGEISKLHYDEYIDNFRKAFPDGRDGIAGATRLLAMKRPDSFVCLNKANQDKLCKAFGIPKSGLTYKRYWYDIVLRIRDCNWWNSPYPKNPAEREAWSARAAFLDAITYEPL